MKFLTFLMLAAVLQVSARTSGQTVSYYGKPVPLSKMFDLIREQTNYGFFYSNKDLEGTGLVNVRLHKEPLENALKLILANQPLVFEIKGYTIFINRRYVSGTSNENDIRVLPEQAPAEDARGVVMDEDGKPIAGVSVSLKRTRMTTVTNEDGHFLLRNVLETDTLVFTSVNYETVSMTIYTRNDLRVFLKQKVGKLDAVTVINTGYQTLNKERATGSFGKPDMGTFSSRTTTMDIVSRLDGLVPGLTLSVSNGNSVHSSNGRPAPRSSIIRGISSVNETREPLYAVNGVLVPDFSSVNPDDVEDITVLKDAAAAAIYGARASNGVIVVTTKSGGKNRPLQLSYTGFLNYQGKPDFKYIPAMNSRQFIETAKEIFNPASYPWEQVRNEFVAPHDQILYDEYRGTISGGQAVSSLDSLAAINNRGQIEDLYFRSALTTNHTVSVFGGNEAYTFYGSLGYTGTQNSSPGTGTNAYKLNFSQSFSLPGDRLKFTLNTSLINTSGRKGNSPAIGRFFIPYQMLVDESGNNINIPYLTNYTDSIRQDYQARSRINLDYYPADDNRYNKDNSNNTTINVTGSASVKLLKGLRFNGTYGYVKLPGTATQYRDARTLAMRNQIISLTVAPTANDEPQYYLPTTGGELTTTHYDQYSWTVRNQLIYETRLRNGSDNFSIQAGQESQEQFRSETTSTVLGYDEVQNTYSLLDYTRLSRGIPGTIPGFGMYFTRPFHTGKDRNRFASYFALASYSLNQKYSVDLSWRRDQSNLFGRDVATQNKPAWSSGVKWHMSRENFMNTVSWINMLALRATFGITGNPPGGGGSQDVLSAVSASNYSNVIAGDAFMLDSYANRGLTWESSRTINLGLDFEALKSRISGSIEFYNKTTTNLTGNIPLNPFTGSTRIGGNIGKLINKGLEVRLNTENIQKANFSWSSMLVFSYNKNKLASYSALNPFLDNAQYKLGAEYVIGHTMLPVFAYRYAGLDEMGDPQIRLADNTVSKQSGIAQPDDLVYKGTLQPVFNGGFTNVFRYRNISLSVNLIYNLGNVMRQDVNLFYTGRLVEMGSLDMGNITTYFNDRWKKPGDEATTQVPSYVADRWESYSRRDISHYISGDINVVSASYLKFRDLTFSYDLPSRLLQTVRMTRMNVFLQAGNFMVWRANKRNIDPEFFDAANSARSLPANRHTYSVGLNVSF